MSPETVRTRSDGTSHKTPGRGLISTPVLRTAAALVAAAGLACAAAPASTPTRTIPGGVTAAGVHVGGLSAEPARRRIEASFLRPLRIVTPRGVTTVAPARAGAVVDV